MTSQASSGKAAFTVQEFLSWATISKTKFYKEVSEGRLAVRKIGTRTIVTVSEANRWLSELPSK